MNHKVKFGARDQLADYLADLAAADPGSLATDDDRLALWLNGYNAAVLQGVLASYGGDHGFSVLDTGTWLDYDWDLNIEP